MEEEYLQALAIDRLDLDNIGVLVQGDLALLERGLGGVLLVKDIVELLKGAVLGLRNEEVDDNGLNCIPDGEDDVSAPANLLHGDWPSELVEKHGYRGIVSLGLSQRKSWKEKKRGGTKKEQGCLPALRAKLEKAIPLARISKLRTSTG